MRSLATHLLLVPALAALLASPAHATEEWQPLAAVREAARTFAQAATPKLGTRQSIEAAKLDSRLKLARCANALETGAAPGVRSAARMIVEVRCPTPGGWRIYVPVTVKTFDRVVVAGRALPRGYLLTAADIAAVDGTVDSLPPGYARTPEEVVGRRLLRGVSAGAVIGTGTVAIEPSVERGQTVTLLARLDGINVRMQGVALASGRVDDRIKIRNLSSGRAVEGIVRSAALVEIPLR
jgi:flagella basal body P-ring formation protein FlgA